MSNSDIATVLTRLMAARRLSTHRLSSMCGVPHTTIHRIATGATTGPRSTNVKAIADALGVTVGQLSGLEPIEDGPNVGPGPAISARVPLISWVQAGAWAEVVDNFQPGDGESMVLTTKKVSRRAFALRVEGDSMEPEFMNGSTIIVDPEVGFAPGRFVVAKVNGQATFKKLVSDGAVAYLRPLNQIYKTIEVTPDVEIVGVVVQQITNY